MSREVNVDEDTTFEDERGGFEQGPTTKVRGVKAFVYLFFLIGLALMGWIIYQNLPDQMSTKDKESNPQVWQGSLPERQFDSTPSNVSFEEPEPKPQPAPTPMSGSKQQPVRKVVVRKPATQPPQKKDKVTPVEKALQRRLAGFSSSSGSNGRAGMLRVARSATTTGGQTSMGAGVAVSDTSSELASRLNTAEYNRVSARLLKHPSMTVPMGTMMLCSLSTEVNTSQPGMIGCQVTHDVYSANGKVLLIPKGTQVVGEISAGLKRGQNRVFVVWSRLRTPSGVIIELSSPGTNRLGSAGIPGQVDTHFWERFGQAMLVSVVMDASDALFQAAVNSTSSTETTVNLGTTRSTGQQLAQQVLQASLRIPPTLYAHQGKIVGIYVARDLDFSSVYNLKYGK